MENIPEKARQVLKDGFIKERVNRGGMFQQVTFRIINKVNGNLTYAILHTDKTIDVSELNRMAEQIGLPVEAQNATAFPKGKSATDFRV
jgi:hypothetical protein